VTLGGPDAHHHHITTTTLETKSRDHAGSCQITRQYCPKHQPCGHVLRADARAERDMTPLGDGQKLVMDNTQHKHIDRDSEPRDKTETKDIPWSG